jgi:hypothetical protein
LKYSDKNAKQIFRNAFQLSKKHPSAHLLEFFRLLCGEESKMFCDHRQSKELNESALTRLIELEYFSLATQNVLSSAVCTMHRELPDESAREY